VYLVLKRKGAKGKVHDTRPPRSQAPVLYKKAKSIAASIEPQDVS